MTGERRSSDEPQPSKRTEMIRRPDVHDYTAVGRLLGMSADQARVMHERYQDSEGYPGPEFCMSEHETAVKIGRPDATMRSRRRRGQYLEGVDYIMRSPQRPLYSRRVLAAELRRRAS
jgi:hypothetical protein